MGVDRCRQTLSIVERTLDGVATERDREHARGCAACTQALARVPVFERELGAAARAFVTEPLPAAVLTSPAVHQRGSWTWSERPLRGLGLVVIAAVIAVVAVIGVGQVGRFEGGPGATQPLIRTESAIVAGLADLGISCRASMLDPKASPPLKGSLCGPAVDRAGVDFLAAVEHDPSGAAAALVAKATVEPVAGDAGRARVEDLVVKSAGLAFPDAADAAAAEAWVRSVLPFGAEVVRQTTTSIGGLDLTFEVVGPGHYFVQVGVPGS